MNLDAKILLELEKSEFGLSTLAISKNCGINRLTATRHLKKLVENGNVIQRVLHQRMFLFLPAKRNQRRDENEGTE